MYRLKKKHWWTVYEVEQPCTRPVNARCVDVSSVSYIFNVERSFSVVVGEPDASQLHVHTVARSASFLAEISVKSPRKLFISII